MTSVYKQGLKDWVSQLDVKANLVIDIGGSQDPIKGRTRSWEVEHYKIYDLENPHSDSARPDVIFNIDTGHININPPDADIIFCLEVFDYIRNPFKAFENLNAMLAIGGEAWVTFPFVYPHHNPIEDEGLRYTEPAIRYYGDRFNMPVEEIVYRRPNSQKLLEFYADDRFRACREYDHNVTGYIVRFKKL